MPSGPHCTARTAATHAEGAEYGEYGEFAEYEGCAEPAEQYGYDGYDGDGYDVDTYTDYGTYTDYDEFSDLDLDLDLDPEEDSEEYGCWLVALVAVDGKSYVYRVYAPPDALLGDLFWEAWHCHDEGPHPRAYDVFDTASIRHIGNLHQE